MAGPLEQQTVKLRVPAGEAQRVYAPGALAQEVNNFVVTEEDTLRAVRGPVEYEHLPAGEVYTTSMPGLFHAGLDGGVSDTLLLRSGDTLWRHAGWKRGWESLWSDLSDDARPKYPDQFVVVNNRIIWSNGIDRALVIAGDGSCHPLGFQHGPGAPVADGPTPPSLHDKLTKGANAEGYSFFGRIGTSSMGVSASAYNAAETAGTLSSEFSAGFKFSNVVDRLLGARYYYYLQWEDLYGNLSPLSEKSNGVEIYADRTYPSMGVDIHDITRQLLARIGGDAPDTAVAMRLYRTPDVNTVSTIPRLLTRIPGASKCLYPDNVPDAELGLDAKDYVPVPVFKVSASYQGRLVVANFADSQGAVRVSDPGFPGTFQAHMLAIPDSGGAEITGLSSHGGTLLVFTRKSVYSLEILPEGINFTPLAQGIGCVAPGSIKGLPDGGLIWLGVDGFYMLKDGAIAPISNPISTTIRTKLSKVRMRSATAAVDPETGEYRCAVSTAGAVGNDVLLCFGEAGWRRVDMGKSIGAICTTDDDRRYTLFTGVETYTSEVQIEGLGTVVAVGDGPVVTKGSVFVFDRERSGYLDWGTATGEMKSVYRSAWFRSDEVGLTPFNVRMMYVGLLDSAADTTGTDPDANVTIRFFKNGRWAPVTEYTDLLAAGVHTPPPASEAVIGTDALVTERRPFWRKVNPDLSNVDTWAFEIEASCSSRLHLQGFAFDIATVGTGTPHGRVPRGDDL